MKNFGSFLLKPLPLFFRRLILKSYEFLLRLITIFRYPFTQDLQLLIAKFTPAQLKAEEQLQEVKICSPLVLNTDFEARLLIVIPFRDHWGLTQGCVDSLLKQDTRGLKILLCLVDNGSVAPETHEGVKNLLQRPTAQNISFRVLADSRPFNYSALNNFAVKQSLDFAPEFVFFLNNDIELAAASSVRALVEFCRHNPSAGAIGCTLLFPDKTIQHLFLAPGIKIAAAHPGKGLAFDPQHLWFQKPRPVPAVTGAALLIRKQLFELVGGFDEKLPTLAQDLDLCLRVKKLGYTNWSLSSVHMFHYETRTREPSFSFEELTYFYDKWGEELFCDPFYSTEFSRWSEKPVLTLGEPRYPWWLVVRK